MTLTKRGFTLIELLVVIAMIATLVAAMTLAVERTRRRARIEKASTEVRTISQAILSWENYSHDGRHQLKEMQDEPTTAASLAFLLGAGEKAESGPIMALLMASVSSGGEIRDPWGHPYRVRIRKGAKIKPPEDLDLKTGFFLPNFYRPTPEERR